VKVLVTGGAGYIGSAAVHRLSSIGHDVVVVDNLFQGHQQALPQGVQFALVDITDVEGMRRILAEAEADAVMHFAALTIAPESVRDPAPYWQTNAAGTMNLLNAMREFDVRTLVVSSTAAVYGVPEVTPVMEASALDPINPYGASKLAAEFAVQNFAQAYGISTAILRYFNVAGATATSGEDHRPETHLIPSALDAAAGRREPLPIYGTDFPTPDGTAIRDYVHIEDLVDAHMLALDRLRAGSVSLGAFNLGTREGASVRQVLEAVERAVGRPVPVEFSERRPGDPPILIADATRARESLGWEPVRSSLDEMVASAWEWRAVHPHGYETDPDEFPVRD
jgi:UDP-glucose 4-epimerase